MGVQHGSPTYRTIDGDKYIKYKDYDLMFGEKEQKQDSSELKKQGIKPRMVTTKKGGSRIIDRSIYIPYS